LYTNESIYSPYSWLSTAIINARTRFVNRDGIIDQTDGKGEIKALTAVPGIAPNNAPNSMLLSVGKILTSIVICLWYMTSSTV